MARIRTIKPDFWTDEKIVELSAFARLLFIGLWNFADDEGRMEFSPKRIKMQIFPADSVEPSELFGELRRAKLVNVYSVDNKEYLQIVNFEKHQKVDKRSASKLPPPPDPAEFPQLPPTEGKGMEEEGKGRESTNPDGLVGAADAGGSPEPSKKPNGKGTRLPADWDLGPELYRWATDEFPGLDVSAELDKFIDYWQARAGPGGVKRDWNAAFRNWMRKANEYAGGRYSQRH